MQRIQETEQLWRSGALDKDKPVLTFAADTFFPWNAACFLFQVETAP